MKSITMSEESYKGIPADAEAFTLEDEKRWFESQDISCMPAVLATLKGLRATVAVTAVAMVDAAGEAGIPIRIGVNAGFRSRPASRCLCMWSARRFIRAIPVRGPVPMPRR